MLAKTSGKAKGIPRETTLHLWLKEVLKVSSLLCIVKAQFYAGFTVADLMIHHCKSRSAGITAAPLFHGPLMKTHEDHTCHKVAQEPAMSGWAMELDWFRAIGEGSWWQPCMPRSLPYLTLTCLKLLNCRCSSEQPIRGQAAYRGLFKKLISLGKSDCIPSIQCMLQQQSCVLQVGGIGTKHYDVQAMVKMG